MERKKKIFHLKRQLQIDGPSHNNVLKDKSVDCEDFILRLKLGRKLGVHAGCISNDRKPFSHLPLINLLYLVNTICWDENGINILSGSDDKQLCVTNPFTSKVLVRINSGHRSNIFSAQFLPCCQSSQIVSCSGDGHISYNIVERDDLHGKNIFLCHYGTAYQVITIPSDPNTFLSCGEDGTVRWFDLRQKTNCAKERCKDDILINCRRAVTSLSANPVLPYHLAVGCSDSSVRIFDRRMLGTRASGNYTGRGIQGMFSRFCPAHLQNKYSRPTSLTYSSDGEEVLVSYSTDYVYLFSAKDDGKKEDISAIEPNLGTDEAIERPSNRDEIDSVNPVKRLRLRGDWSDTGPKARPRSERSQEDPPARVSIVQRMSEMLTRWLEDTSSQHARRTSRREDRTSTSSSDRSVGLTSSSSPESDRGQGSVPGMETETGQSSGEGQTVGAGQVSEEAVGTSEDVSPVLDERDTSGARKKDKISSNKNEDANNHLEKVKLTGSTDRAKEKTSEDDPRDEKHDSSQSKLLASSSPDTKTVQSFSSTKPCSLRKTNSGAKEFSRKRTSEEAADSRGSDLPKKDEKGKKGEVRDKSGGKGWRTGEGGPSKRKSGVDRREEKKLETRDQSAIQNFQGAKTEAEPSEDVISEEDMEIDAEVEPKNETGSRSEKEQKESGKLGNKDKPRPKDEGVVFAHTERREDSRPVNRKTSQYSASVNRQRKVSVVEPPTELAAASSAADEQRPGTSTSSPGGRATTSLRAEESVSQLRNRFETGAVHEPRRPRPRRPSPNRRLPFFAREVLVDTDDMAVSDTDSGTESEDETQTNTKSEGDDRDIEERSREGSASATQMRLKELFRNRRKQREKEKEMMRNVDSPRIKMVFKGHRNSRTMIKESNFWGKDYVLSGSDCGHVFIWNKSTGSLVTILEGDRHVVNCVQPHPTDPILASSGIDYDIKVWMPLASEVQPISHASEVIRINELMLEETRDTITVPPSFMLRMLASLNQLRTERRHAAEQPHTSSDEEETDS